MKKSVHQIYGVYAISFWTALLLPRFLILKSILDISNKFTICFSNTPGPLKPFKYKDQNTGQLTKMMTIQCYINVAGQVGFALSAVTCIDSLRICLSSDDGVCDEFNNRELIQSVYKNIISEIERVEKSD